MSTTSSSPAARRTIPTPTRRNSFPRTSRATTASASPTSWKATAGNRHAEGAGLIRRGGPKSFGAGGWQGPEGEKALPVTADLKSVKVEGKSGLVLIMHASEMAEGNAWQKKIAKLSIEKLSP